MIRPDEWPLIFDALPSILPLQWTRSARNKWTAPQKLDGSPPKVRNNSKTAAFLNSSNIQLHEAGENPLSLIDWLLSSGMQYGEAADTLKAAAGIISEQRAPQTGKRDFPSPVKESPKSAPEPVKTIIPTDPEELKKHLQSKQLEITGDGFSGTCKEYIEEARSLYYCNEWKLLHDVWTGTHKGYPSILLQWTAPDGRKGGFYHIDPLLLTEKKAGKPRSMKPREERKAAREWIPGHGTTQTGTTGGAVRIAPPTGGVVGICEGLEDALSIMQVEGYYPSSLGYPEARDREQAFYGGELTGEDPFPIWPTLGKEALKKFIPPEEVNTVFIFPDRGSSSSWEKELQPLTERIEKSGKKCTVVYPPENCKDWNEYIIRRLENFTPPASKTA